MPRSPYRSYARDAITIVPDGINQGIIGRHRKRNADRITSPKYQRNRRLADRRHHLRDRKTTLHISPYRVQKQKHTLRICIILDFCQLWQNMLVFRRLCRRRQTVVPLDSPQSIESRDILLSSLLLFNSICPNSRTISFFFSCVSDIYSHFLHSLKLKEGAAAPSFSFRIFWSFIQKISTLQADSGTSPHSVPWSFSRNNHLPYRGRSSDSTASFCQNKCAWNN